MIEVTAFSRTFSRIIGNDQKLFRLQAWKNVNKNWYIYNPSNAIFFFCSIRNDLKTRETCSFARFHSDQTKNKTNPHPSHHSTASNQSQAVLHSQPATATQHTHNQDQSAKPAVQPPAARPPHPTPGSHKASGGDGWGRTAGVHPQGDCAERLRGLIYHACQRVCWSSGWVTLMVTMTFGIVQLKMF